MFRSSVDRGSDPRLAILKSISLIRDILLKKAQEKGVIPFIISVFVVSELVIKDNKITKLLIYNGVSKMQLRLEKISIVVTNKEI